MGFNLHGPWSKAFYYGSEFVFRIIAVLKGAVSLHPKSYVFCSLFFTTMYLIQPFLHKCQINGLHNSCTLMNLFTSAVDLCPWSRVTMICGWSIFSFYMDNHVFVGFLIIFFSDMGLTMLCIILKRTGDFRSTI